MGMLPYTADFSEQMRADHGIDVTANQTHQSALEPALGLTFRELL